MGVAVMPLSPLYLKNKLHILSLSHKDYIPFVQMIMNDSNWHVLTTHILQNTYSRNTEVTFLHYVLETREVGETPC